MDCDEPPFDPAAEALRSVAECAPGTKRLEVVAAPDDANDAPAPSAAPPGGHGAHGAAHLGKRADVRLVAELLEGETVDIVFGFDGAAATFRATVAQAGTAGAPRRLVADSVHELLMRASPRYGAWYLNRVAASLLEADAAASPKASIG